MHLGTGPPGSATSYAWLYTGLDGMAPYNVFHWSLTHENCVIDEHLAGYCGIFVGDACGANARLDQRSGGRIAVLREYIEAIDRGRWNYRPGFGCAMCDFRQKRQAWDGTS